MIFFMFYSVNSVISVANNMISQWQPTPDDLTLSPDYVDIWKCCVELTDDQIGELLSLLSTEEKARAQRLKIAEKKNQFIITRGRLRQILGKYLNSDPRAFKFDYATHGKPYLEERWQGHEISFNVTHSHNYILIAMSLDHQLGIDIEKIRHDRDHTALARRFFSKREQAELTTLSEEVKIRAFYSCWARKEAFVKAVGDGITYGLDTFDVSVYPDVGKPSLNIHTSIADDKTWSIINIPMDEDYMAALAVTSDTVSVRCWV
jgi:4'-phosphopantetheinyl transferase